jgi:Na+-driven multidrug efflux pump
VFVSLFGWGVIGAASATVLSQIMSAALVLITLSHAPSAYRFSFKKMSFHRSALMNIFILGLPIGLGSCMYPISNIFVHIGVNRFQTDTIAAWAVVGKLDFLIWLIIEAFAVTISTFVAQNYGACCMERVKKGMHFCIALNIVLIAGLSVILYLFAEPLGQLFIHDTAVIAISVDMLRFIAPFYVTFVCGDILAGAIRGTGETFMPMLLTMIGTCALRVFWILIAMPLHFTVFTVIMVYPITWIVTSVLFVFYYRICSRTRLVPEQLYYKRRLLYKKREIM